MLKGADGSFVLDLDPRLVAINKDGENGKFISEADLQNAVKGFKLSEALTELGFLSNKIYSKEMPIDWEKISKGFYRHKETGLFVSQSAIEYLENIFIISGSNDFKALSIRDKDNLLGLFNIYNNALVIGSVESRSVISIMVSLWQEQFRSQTNDLQSFGRVIYLFQRLDKEMLQGRTLSNILNEKVGLTIEEYLNISLVFLAFALQSQIVLIGSLKSESKDFQKIITDESLRKFLGLFAAKYDEFRVIDQELNKNLIPKDTKNRFNPLWKKPIIEIAEGKYLIPSLTAYIQATMNGLYWWFDDLFMAQEYEQALSRTTFREFFGKQIFEPYVGILLADIYGEGRPIPEIIYGSKKKKAFTDWVVIDGDDAYLVEAKAYQFPFKTLQTGDLELVAHEITKKLVSDTIQKINKKILDIAMYPELSFLKNKNLIPVVATYNVPLIDTTLYRTGMEDVLDKALYQIFSEFNGYFMNIADLENFRFVSNDVKLKDILITTKNNNSNFQTETAKIFKVIKNKGDKTFAERIYREKMDYVTKMLGSTEDKNF